MKPNDEISRNMRIELFRAVTEEWEPARVIIERAEIESDRAAIVRLDYMANQGVIDRQYKHILKNGYTTTKLRAFYRLKELKTESADW